MWLLEDAKAKAKDNLQSTLKASTRLLEDAKAEVKDILESTLKASALSEAKSKKLYASAGKQPQKKIASITSKSNKRVENSKMDFEHLQQDCIIQADTPI